MVGDETAPAPFPVCLGSKISPASHPLVQRPESTLRLHRLQGWDDAVLYLFLADTRDLGMEV